MSSFVVNGLMRIVRDRGLVEEFVRYELLRKLLSNVSIDPLKQELIWSSYLNSNGISSNDELKATLIAKYTSIDIQRDKVFQPYQLICFREDVWGSTVSSMYLQQKEAFDSVCFSMLRSRDFNVMQEIYFRLNDGEETWQQLSVQLNPDYPDSPVFYGPTMCRSLSPELVAHLYHYGEGVISFPVTIGGWSLITRLEQIIPSDSLDSVKDILLKERFDIWFQEQLSLTMESLVINDDNIELSLSPEFSSLASQQRLYT